MSARCGYRVTATTFINNCVGEQQERNQLFFVLEQFFSHAKQNPDPLNKAQEAIVDYFKDTENTFFFDKNKI